MSDDLFDQIQKFTCHMYTSDGHTDKVNELRYHLFCTKRGEVDSSQLPPLRECLYMHVLRANYQARIWRCSLQREIQVPDPKVCGWTIDDEGSLSIDCMRTPPAPDAVLEFLACKCSRSCKMPRCTCLLNKLPCTQMCKLKVKIKRKTI